ncbi:MAG: tRNA lysidine(34) synthetase TilS [Candidatus Aminicenantales bacterium]
MEKVVSGFHPTRLAKAKRDGKWPRSMDSLSGNKKIGSRRMARSEREQAPLGRVVRPLERDLRGSSDLSRRARLFFEKVKKSIEKYELLNLGDKVLIAYSGGPDSTALLAAFLELRKLYSLRLTLAHFNHRLRRSAAADEKFAIQVAQEHALPLYLRRENIRAYARQHRLNIEDAGRQRRYAFLRQTAAKIGATKIATGHTMTDQAETFLLRLLRGSGPGGLTGIAPCVDGLIIRPLLAVERSEIESFLKARQLPFRIDESNYDRRYLRNRVRLELIPFLEKRFEPRIVRQIARLVDVWREEEEFLNGMSQTEAKRAIRLKDDQIWLDMKAVHSLSLPLARRVVRIFLAQIKGDLKRIGYRNVEAVRQLGENKEVQLPGGPVLWREKSRVFLKPAPRSKATWEYYWDGIEKLTIPEIGLSFSGRGRKIKSARARRLPFDDSRRAILDRACLRFPLLVRNRRPGDRYRPLGAPGSKRLKEILRHRGIPLAQREAMPVFLSNNQIIWVLGLPVAEPFKVGPKTGEIFIIEKAGGTSGA